MEIGSNMVLSKMFLVFKNSMIFYLTPERRISVKFSYLLMVRYFLTIISGFG